MTDRIQSEDTSLGLAALISWGFGHFFAAQLDERERAQTIPMRVTAVHRDALELQGIAAALRVAPMRTDDEPEAAATAGDWVLVHREHGRIARVLGRRSVFKRKAAGEAHRVQLIAANVDTVFLVTSANHDFNPARLERFLALAREAGVTPVVVITKVDLCTDVSSYLTAARRIMPGLIVEALDARTPETAHVLAPWAAPGQTLAFLGSSGTGKSTLVNALSGAAVQKTQDIREHDAKGKHTTTGRTLYRLPGGAWLMDTPGMRELQLYDVAQGIDAVFEDIVALEKACRFSDCRHDDEPGCAVMGAIAAGTLDPARLKRYQKLAREERRNSESLADAHARNRAFGRMAKRKFAEKLKNRWGI